MENILKIDTNLELINDDNAFASVSLNPLFQWAKIVVTDDQPNYNKQRIPLDEFENLSKTGVHSPIKMDFGQISDHEESFGKPIGVITQIIQEQNKLIALAALWKKERSDVSLLKEMFDKGTPPQVSWEISYAQSEMEEGDIEVLKGTILNGLAVVAHPAYTGRTPFVAMSSKNKNEEEASVEELEQLKTKVAELENQLKKLQDENVQKETELKDLREYKAGIEKEKTDADKIKSVLNKFKEANIEKDEEFFNENKEKFLSMSDEMLDFMVQEMVAFSTKNTSASKTVDSKVPKIPADNNENLKDPRELGRLYRELQLKK